LDDEGIASAAWGIALSASVMVLNSSGDGGAMAKTSAWAKAERVLRFLLALSNPRIVGVMVAHGFSEADLDEGWRLLRAVRPVRLEPLPPTEPAQRSLERLLAWDSEWVPIARATLKRHFPKLHERLFVHAVAREAHATILFLDSFFRTLDELARGGADGKKARKLLAQRGLSPQVVSAGRALLDEVKVPKNWSVVERPEDRSDWAERESALWSWYLEWGAIALRKVKDRNLLRQLGFLRPARTGQSAAEAPGPLDDEEPSSPRAT
jgi:hypothetical protein